MGILWMVIIGFVVGLIARALMPGKDPAGFIVTCLLGIVGAFVGGFIGQALGLYAQGEAAGLIMSVIGAMLVLFIYRAAIGRRSTI